MFFLTNDRGIILYAVFLMPLIISLSVFADPRSFTDNTGAQLSGSLRAVMEFEENEIDESDLDLNTYLRFDARRILDDRLSFHFYGRYRRDLDGKSVTDRALDRSESRIFQAYVDFNDKAVPLLIRAGRQWVHEVDGAYIDGVLVRMDFWEKLGLTVFGGIPVPAYSSSAGDTVVGGRIDFRPFQSSLISLSGVRSDDNNPFVNDRISLHLEQKLGQSVRFYYDQTFLNKREEDLRIGANAYINPMQLQLQFNYYRLLSSTPRPERDDVDGRYYSRLFSILEQMQELERYHFTATKYFGEHFAVSGGMSFTRIREKENPTNRDSNHYFVSLQFFDLLVENLNFSIDANRVTSDLSTTSTDRVSNFQLDGPGSEIDVLTTAKQDEDTFFITGELEYVFRKGLSAGFGASYGSFEFDRVLSSTQPVSELVPTSLRITGSGETFINRTYFARTDWKINRHWSLKLLTEFNRSKINSGADTDSYWRWVGSVRYRF